MKGVLKDQDNEQAKNLFLSENQNLIQNEDIKDLINKK